jgi:hypothetical protein
MPKSRSGQLIDHAPHLRVTPFLLLNADPSILRYQNPIYSRTKHKMNNFCLWSIFVRSASASRRLEPLCETQSGCHRSSGAVLFLQPTSERSELRQTSATYNLRGVAPRLRGVTHCLFSASCLAYPCVTNRVVSIAYPICTPLPPFFRQMRHTVPSRCQKPRHHPCPRLRTPNAVPCTISIRRRPPTL